MHRWAVIAGGITAAVSLAAPTLAVAHGPCRCTTPTSGPPGTELAIDTQTLDVVWNPPPDQLRIAPTPLIAGYYVPDTTTERLADNPEPVDFERVLIPEVPPGRYLAVIYDGSEQGNHYTWDYVNVTASASHGGVNDGAISLDLLAVALVGGLGVVLAIWLRLRAA
jgi:hypothetical protein